MDHSHAVGSATEASSPLHVLLAAFERCLGSLRFQAGPSELGCGYIIGPGNETAADLGLQTT